MVGNEFSKKEATERPADDVTAVIMAGGKSRRMGTDKAFVPFQGKLMIQHVIERIEGVASRQLLVTNEPPAYAFLGLPMVSDIFQDCGPLAGFHTALYHAATPYILVVACDMPWLNPHLLRYMLSLRHDFDAVVPRWTKFPEPLHAVYHQNCLAPIEEKLRARQFKSIAFYDQVRVRYLEREEIARIDSEGRSFHNINSPQDLEE